MWEKQYQAGEWEWIKQVDELARYSIIAGYFEFLKPGGSILDVGCGEGTLRRRLHPQCYSFYRGIDLSETAIARASSLQSESSEFLVVDAEAYETDDRFDAIIINESLYYCDQPIEVLRRLRHALKDDGILIVSMLRYKRTFFIWRRIAREFQVVDETRIVNGHGSIWICKVLRP